MNLRQLTKKFPYQAREFFELRAHYLLHAGHCPSDKASYEVVKLYLAVDAAWARLWLAAAIERAERYAESHEVTGTEFHYLPGLGLCGETIPGIDWYTPEPRGGEDGV
ncbi:MAG: hypothetical protein JSV81_10355 [Anaerolineales bacterium]|nr:MAG: hypothetical protein JSV81_10355 [Anaerolineales bacterium]